MEHFLTYITDEMKNQTAPRAASHTLSGFGTLPVFFFQNVFLISD